VLSIEHTLVCDLLCL